MKLSKNLQKLIDALAPYWAAEAEVVRAYFASKKRDRQSDLLWLARQCRKEFWDGFDEANPGLFIGPLQKMLGLADKIDRGVDRHEILDMTEGLHAEFAHYCAFADAYDAMALPGEKKLNPHDVKQAWKEDLDLSQLRFRHKKENPKLGERATRFTEGGYCTLFSEGMKLRSRGDDPSHGRNNLLIAEACAKVYEDEFGHMLKGVVGLDSEGLSEAEWQHLGDISVEQLKARILMRNAQFSYPLDEKRVKEIFAGTCAPLAFDYEKAKLAA
jgi:hypothetical protein